MINIKEFIKKDRTERQQHMNLNEVCCERGGNSTNHKGVLAQYLNTTIPSGRILLCHGCNNKKCSNPKHLYWGTDYENIILDSKWLSPWDRMVKKYGYEEACRRNSRPKNTNGSGNKGKPKTDDHKKKIAESINRKYN